MKVTILFDKEKNDASLHAGWGIAYMIDDVLFDTGENAEYLLENMRVLRVAASAIRHIFLSHNHWDHRSGLWEVLSRSKDAQVYVCPDFLEEFEEKARDFDFKAIMEFSEIAPRIYSSGCFHTMYKNSRLMEHFLIARTDKGISCVFGCAHPGILTLLQKVRIYFPGEKIYSVFGGFHLMEADPRLVTYIAHEMKKMGITLVGPSHCTGHDAIAVFKEVFKDGFLDIAAGAKFEI